MLTGTMNQTRDNKKSWHRQVFLLVLIGLLILRIPFFAGMRFFNIQWAWTESVYQIGTYLLTTFLIWWEVDNLTDYHIDTLAVLIIILFKPVQTLVLKYRELNDDLLAFPGTSSLIMWSIAIVFAIAMWLKRSKLPGIKSVGLGWLVIGIAAGFSTMVVLSYPVSFQVPASSSLPLTPVFKRILTNIPSSFVLQIGWAAVAEEPLFRGFLWGFLKKRNWREHWIWLFQAGLFTFSHIYYINTLPIFFWIFVPVCTLVLGWLVWRSRTIATSMVAHGMINATTADFSYLMALLRVK